MDVAERDGAFAAIEFHHCVANRRHHPALQQIERLAADKIWSLRCLTGGGRCGVAWNTLFLALACGAGTTSLGLAFALIATRTGFRFKKTLRVLTVLPIVTPPFVIGLALIGVGVLTIVL